MTTIIDGSAGITFPNGSNPQAAPSKVLQVVTGTTTTNTSTTSSSFADTGLTATITPLFSTSTILILVQVTSCYANSTGTSGSMNFCKNGSQIYLWANECGYSTAGQLVQGPVSGFYIDSPATTSSTTYKVQVKRADGSGTFYFNSFSNNCYLTLMEIAQ